MNANPRVMEYFPSILSPEESVALMKKLSAAITDQGWGLWAMEEKSSHHCLGFTGLNRVTDELPFGPAVEIGWRLSDQYWGKGYATEAAQKTLEFAFEKLQIDEIVSFTAVINGKSRAVMERIGMKNSNNNFMHPKITDGHRLKEHVLYTISRRQWLERDVHDDLKKS